MIPSAESKPHRLTVEMGVEAYRATRVRPERGIFVVFASPEGADGAVLESASSIGVLRGGR